MTRLCQTSNTANDESEREKRVRYRYTLAVVLVARSLSCGCRHMNCRNDVPDSHSSHIGWAEVTVEDRGEGEDSETRWWGSDKENRKRGSDVKCGESFLRFIQDAAQTSQSCSSDRQSARPKGSS
jgi:hypothetical protein